jgi:hypothetical protein
VTEQDDFIDDHGAHAPATHDADDVGHCVTCGGPLERGRYVRCQACLDAEWLRLRAQDRQWYERHKDYHRHG